MRRSLTAIALAGALGCGGVLRAADRPDGGTPAASAALASPPVLADWECEVLADIELLLDLDVVEDLDLWAQLDELSALSEGESR